MIILDRSQANNTINFIPRSYNPTGGNIFKIELKKEAENTVNYTANVSALTSLKYYYTYTANFNLDTTKDVSYILEITNTNTSSVIYRDKVFATNQASTTYTMNNNKFVTNTSSANDFLIYE